VTNLAVQLFNIGGDASACWRLGFGMKKGKLFDLKAVYAVIQDKTSMAKVESLL